MTISQYSIVIETQEKPNPDFVPPPSKRDPYYFNYLSWGSATCSKCRYATKLKSGAYRCRRKNYDIKQLKCFKPMIEVNL